MKKSSVLIALALLVIATIWVVSGQNTPQESTLKKKENNTKQSVLVQKFSTEDFIDHLVVNGRSRASRSVILKAEISARTERIEQEKGTFVKEGETLVFLKKEDREHREREAKQRVQQKQIEYNAALKLKKEGFNSDVRIAESRAELESARATLRRAQLDLKNTQLTAPFDGIIDRQYVEVGDFMGVGDNILKLVDLDPIEFEVFISEQDIQDIKQGGAAEITLIDGTHREGVISYVSVSADDETRTFPVEISLENKDLQLKEGMTVELRIPLSPKKAHKIPSSLLVLNDTGQVGVRSVEEDNRVSFTPIKVLASGAQYNWVSGLEDAVTLIIQGQEFVTEGQIVRPQQTQ